MLFEHVQKSYDREVDDNESLWRSLPLFAVLLGFVGSILNFLVTSAPAPADAVGVYVIYTLIAAAGLLYANAIRHLGRMIWPRVYRYLPRDERTRAYAEELAGYYERQGLSAAEADAAAARDLRRFLVAELAAAATHNQRINQVKANARVQALAYLFFGLIFSFAASASIIIQKKLNARMPAVEEIIGGRPEAAREMRPEQGKAAGAARTSIDRGGRASSVSPEIGSQLAPDLEPANTANASR